MKTFRVPSKEQIERMTQQQYDAYIAEADAEIKKHDDLVAQRDKLKTEGYALGMKGDLHGMLRKRDELENIQKQLDEYEPEPFDEAVNDIVDSIRRGEHPLMRQARMSRRKT